MVFLFVNRVVQVNISLILNVYKTLLKDDNKFTKAFPDFQENGFKNTPWLYQALNLHDSTCQVRFDNIGEDEKIEKGEYILPFHLNALLQYLPSVKNIVNFTNISITSNNEVLSLPVLEEHQEGVAKVVSYLKNLDPTQLRSTTPSETIAIFQLCQHWMIKGQESEIFYHHSEKDLANENFFIFACSTKNQFLLNKSIRGLFQQATISEEASGKIYVRLIKQKPPIEKLDLSGLGLSDSHIKLLGPCKKQLKELNLKDNSKLTDKSLSHLTELINLSSLNLEGCDLLTDEGLRSLEVLPLLKDAKVEKALIQAIDENDQKQLEKIIMYLFEHANKSEEHLPAVRELLHQYSPPLKKLNCISMCDATFALLEELGKIEGLGLDSSWTDIGLKSLEHLTHLTSLNLAGCKQLTDISLKSLENLTSLTSLDLSWICFLGGIDLTDTGFKSLENLTNLTSLKLYCCTQLTDTGIKSLEKLTNLTSLDLTQCIELIDIKGLENLTSLTSLNLSGCYKLTDTGLKSLENLTSLTSLNLHGCKQLTDTGLKSLENLTSLTSLDLYGCEQLTDTGLKSLENLTSLTSLNLYGCKQLTDTGLKSLENLTNLTSLKLCGCKQLTDTGLKSLEKLINLTSLDLDFCDLLTERGLRSLEAMTKLKSLKVAEGCVIM
jgi:Leucine-rich repeat (LRR) protein